MARDSLLALWDAAQKAAHHRVRERKALERWQGAARQYDADRAARAHYAPGAKGRASTVLAALARRAPTSRP